MSLRAPLSAFALCLLVTGAAATVGGKDHWLSTLKPAALEAGQQLSEQQLLDAASALKNAEQLIIQSISTPMVF
ncbi:hypothetical protein DV711_12415 [Motiliproteus coralliicola]|uniref:Uncharacterized protein n=1 Tax=Motiliproteus coralliicola TaxID=2283196 RepID=A0A369WCC7_9GAMM|nr:hypothetical protein [Motiliproteus coralliicola]RDE19680.1 hypothetical protein DV711_12415 [Motiliproteus coralliicola]